MTRSKAVPARGFALITVLCVVLIVSAVALTMAASMRVEAREAAGDRAGLEAEQLASAGQEMATYLISRGLGSTIENLADVPVEVVQAGFHYVIHFPEGDVDLYLDAEDGKLNLSTAPKELLEAFFSSWTGDAGKGTHLAAVVQDWRDTDRESEADGAEEDVYVQLGYAPRNRGLGVGDVALLHGLEPQDFRDRLTASQQRRVGLNHFLTDASVGTTINPAFAPELVLRAVPGLSETAVGNVLVERRVAPFKDMADFSGRVGVPLDSPVAMFLHFVRRAPTILTIARSADGRIVRSERRRFLAAGNVLVGVERNVIPDYVASE